jgi:hypothetical protein
MYRVMLLALAVCLVAVSAASADVPLPKDQKYVTPKVRFEGLDKQADHVFFLKWKAGNGNPNVAPTVYRAVKNGEVFEITGGRRIIGVQLFAVPKDVAAKHEKDATMEWLDKEAGVLKADVVAPNTVVSVKLTEAPTTPYKVSVADGKMKVEKQAEEVKTGAAPSRMPTIVGATALSLSLALFGVWFTRRRTTVVG